MYIDQKEDATSHAFQSLGPSATYFLQIAGREIFDASAQRSPEEDTDRHTPGVRRACVRMCLRGLFVQRCEPRSVGSNGRRSHLPAKGKWPDGFQSGEWANTESADALSAGSSWGFQRIQTAGSTQRRSRRHPRQR